MGSGIARGLPSPKPPFPACRRIKRVWSAPASLPVRSPRPGLIVSHTPPDPSRSLHPLHVFRILECRAWHGFCDKGGFDSRAARQPDTCHLQTDLSRPLPWACLLPSCMLHRLLLALHDPIPVHLAGLYRHLGSSHRDSFPPPRLFSGAPVSSPHEKILWTRSRMSNMLQAQTLQDRQDVAGHGRHRDSPRPRSSRSNQKNE